MKIRTPPSRGTRDQSGSWLGNRHLGKDINLNQQINQGIRARSEQPAQRVLVHEILYNLQRYFHFWFAE